MMERHSLLDGDATPTQEHGNVFGDEFEADFEFDGVADGFRPNVDREGEGARASDDAAARQDDDFHDPPIRTVSAHYAPGPVSPAMSAGPSRNSMRKSRSGAANPFASPEDEGTEAQEREHSLEFEPDTVARRSVSSASSHMYAQTGSPRFGAGPSHPYGMYQQGTMARSPSVATTSTLRPAPRQSYSQNRPQHPYALYPQGVDADMDDEDEDAIQQNPVPVGFPGVTQNYTRRLGPDGEDQDIIHEDGHTEQLPPYTRYPEDGPEKAPLLMPTALHSRAPVAGTDPGMPLMHQTIIPSSTPAPQSMSDQSALLDHNNGSTSNLVRSNTRASDRGSLLNMDKRWSEKTWKEKRKTKFCGIPFWWIVLALCVLGFIAAVLGGVIGGFVAGGKHANASNLKVVTSLYDASPIASPTSGAPPTGTFALTLGQPQETQCDCLPQASQRVAWSCDLAPNAALGLVVKNQPNGPGSGANLFYASYNDSIAYGSQLNTMNTSLSSFITVQDNDDPDNGPAFYFQQFYDKVVVVPETAISAPSGSKSRRGRRQGYLDPDFKVPSEWSQRKALMAKPGEKPWFCVWNGTFLEGFIYVQEPAATPSASATNSSNATAASTTPPPGSTAISSSATSASSPTPTVPPTTTSSYPGPPSDMISTVISDALTTATYAGPMSQYEAWSVGIHAQAAQSQRQKEKAYEQALANNPHAKRERDGIDKDDLWNKLDRFPYVIKIEERRLPSPSTTPYCQQYQILDNHHANFVTDNDGNPIIVELTENDPPFAAYQSAGVASTKKRKRTVPGGCHCQWMSGE